MQVPHHLIQRRRKARIDIQKNTIHLPNLQDPPQIRNHDFEALRARDTANLLPKRRRAAHSLEMYGYLGLGQVAGC